MKVNVEVGYRVKLVLDSSTQFFGQIIEGLLEEALRAGKEDYDRKIVITEWKHAPETPEEDGDGCDTGT